MTARLEKRDLISRVLDSDPRIATFLFATPQEIELRYCPARLLESNWELDREDRVLIRAALDFCNGTGHVFLSEVLTLDDPAFNRLPEALQQSRNRRPCP